jgi:simple sugar transport system ATP-binding protein
VALHVNALTRHGHYDDITFEIRAGEVLGVTGLLGSGRTSLALSLFGLLEPDSGQVVVDGKAVALRSTQDALRAGIGYVPEDRLREGLFLPQPIGKNVVVRVIDALVGAPGVLSQPRINSAISTWIDRLNIRTQSAANPVSSLSGGNQQRVVLAKWMAASPRIMILNGPTVGVDVGSKLEIHDIIRQLAAQGMAVLVISDDLPELLHVCNRIFLMRRGRIVQQFDRRLITEEELNAMLVAA